MAYMVNGMTAPDLRGESLLVGMLGCYDTIGDPDFDMDRDECLHLRSAYEFVRADLDADQRAELQKVDAYWRARPATFNADFAPLHYRADKASELAGFVVDDAGKVPEIPPSHWWWWPLDEAADTVAVT